MRCRSFCGHRTKRPVKKLCRWFGTTTPSRSRLGNKQYFERGWARPFYEPDSTWLIRIWRNLLYRTELTEQIRNFLGISHRDNLGVLHRHVLLRYALHLFGADRHD